MKRSTLKPVPEDTKLEHGWLLQERCPNGRRNCSPASPSCPGRRVALWLPFTVPGTKTGPQQEVESLAGHRNIATHAYQGGYRTQQSKRPLASKPAAFCPFH